MTHRQQDRDHCPRGTVVSTTNGPVRGTTIEEIHRFLGVPYAAAPVGALRYSPPRPPIPWDHERDATAFGPVCLQQPMPGIFGEIGTPQNPAGEDCLNLNVWTPDPGASGLPVLVWIHGGAFFAGSGIDDVYDGTAFARDGIVCVTINYRLGAQGFWHLAEQIPELSHSGNAGLLDQIAALEWVRDNIAAFGGDPSLVTIAGERAGGMSVGTLMATPNAKGLFRRAIPQSGAGHNGLSASTASMIAGHLLKMLGVAPDDVDGLLALSPELVLDAQGKLSDEMTDTRDVARFREAAASAMVFQPTYGTELVPLRPIDAIAAGSAADIDVTVGTTNEEALIFMGEQKEMFNEALVEASLDASMATIGRSGSETLSVYRANRPDAQPHEVAAAAETDRMFRLPAIRLAEAQSNYNPNIFMYRFDWRSTAMDGKLGACHFLEVPFVFDRLDNDHARRISGDPPQVLADAVHSAWVSFVKTGDPNDSALREWPTYGLASRSTMCFDMTPTVVDDPASDERVLWDGVL